MEIVAAVALAILGGLWSLAFRNRDAFDRLSMFLKSTLRLIAMLAAGAMFGLTAVMRGLDPQRLANALLFIAAGCIVLLAYLHFLPWVRGEKANEGGDKDG